MFDGSERGVRGIRLGGKYLIATCCSPLQSRCASLVLRGVHQLADGFKQRGNILIVGFNPILQLRQFSCQLLVRSERFPQLHEGAHNEKQSLAEY